MTMESIFTSSEYMDQPRSVIHTTYPVWRARDLPFGKGMLSLPQRSETALEMWAHGSEGLGFNPKPVKVFEGHTDVVKEFVWRRGGSGEPLALSILDDAAHEGQDWNDFQLITWSTDKTIRLWPVDLEVMQVSLFLLP